MKRRLPPVLRRTDFSLYLASLTAYGLAREMIFVAVGWQVYEIARNPFHLGLVGLAEFLPLPLFALPAGAIADRLSRKLVFIVSLAIDAAITAGLLVVTPPAPTRSGRSSRSRSRAAARRRSGTRRCARCRRRSCPSSC